ncbi:uncharacterized protein LOC114719533 [Neltuma alba]|uniref:uncharacterized protein LOC114719533 n=1 Tax=Neltuma alba TaxID=207710 RepID=UPI0010A3C902|nr:uncharacterized protein LOC114719533 [Prosopis alba]
MRNTLLLWFLMLLTILTYSACASKANAEHDDSRISKSPLQPRYMYGVIMGSNETSNQRRVPRVNNVKHDGSLSHIGKPINGASSDLLRRPNGKRHSSSFSSKPSSLLRAALKHLFLGLLLFACYY